MIRLYRWDAAAKAADCPPADQLPPTAADVAGESCLWVDLEDPTPEEEQRVFGQFLKVHSLTLEDVTRPRREVDKAAHLPKAEEFPDYLFVVVNPLPWEVCDPNAPPQKPTWVRPQLSAILGENVLITHHHERLSSVDAVRGYVGRRGEVSGRGPDFLFHLVLDEMVDEYAPVVERVAEQLDRLETRMFNKPDPTILRRLLRLKRRVLFLRKTLVLEREVLARLTRGEFALVSDRERVYYRNVYDHLVRYTELIESAREMTSDLMQTHLSAASHRLNEVMKVLTMISTVVLPMTLVAGVYGMNFENLPEKNWYYGYYMALGLMAAMGVASFAVFRWKKWI